MRIHKNRKETTKINKKRLNEKVNSTVKLNSIVETKF